MLLPNQPRAVGAISYVGAIGYRARIPTVSPTVRVLGVEPAPAPHLAHAEGCAALRIVLVTVLYCHTLRLNPRVPFVSRDCHFVLRILVYLVIHDSG